MLLLLLLMIMIMVGGRAPYNAQGGVRGVGTVHTRGRGGQAARGGRGGAYVVDRSCPRGGTEGGKRRAAGGGKGGRGGAWWGHSDSNCVVRPHLIRWGASSR